MTKDRIMQIKWTSGQLKVKMARVKYGQVGTWNLITWRSPSPGSIRANFKVVSSLQLA